jgi:short-subunit dehydrogenase involved in D-alanine esterification of teichoic acids
VVETDARFLTVFSITGTFPDLDCLFLNSGIQRGFNFSNPDAVDLDAVQLEFTTNYLSHVALTKAFLPFLQKKKENSAII